MWERAPDICGYFCVTGCVWKAERCWCGLLSRSGAWKEAEHGLISFSFLSIHCSQDGAWKLPFNSWRSREVYCETTKKKNDCERGFMSVFSGWCKHAWVYIMLTRCSEEETSGGNMPCLIAAPYRAASSFELIWAEKLVLSSILTHAALLH